VQFDELRQRVGVGEYKIDTHEVADALLRRWAFKDPGLRRRPGALTAQARLVKPAGPARPAR
jgi:hypothetical protein